LEREVLVVLLPTMVALEVQVLLVLFMLMGVELVNLVLHLEVEAEEVLLVQEALVMIMVQRVVTQHLLVAWVRMLVAILVQGVVEAQVLRMMVSVLNMVVEVAEVVQLVLELEKKVAARFMVLQEEEVVVLHLLRQHTMVVKEVRQIVT
jgi:hypothetical protein